MVKPKIYLLITIIILVIIVIKVQYYFKIFEEFSKYGLTCNQCSGCDAGQERVNCSGTNTGECSACTGETYKSDDGNGECQNVPHSAKTSDNINWWCDAGYSKSGNSCTACTDRTYKSHDGDGECIAVPDHAKTSDNINWSCDAGYYKSGNSCIACTGQTYKSHDGDGECIVVPYNSKPTWNKKDWSCDAGYYKSGNICIACTGQTYKPDSGNGTCIVVPYNSKPTWNKKDWSCDAGYYKSGNSCIACTGQTYKPYSGNGVCIGVPPLSQPTWDKKGWSCNTGYFKSGNSCSVCGACPAGEERVNCYGNNQGYCNDCPSWKYKRHYGYSSCIPIPTNARGSTWDRKDFSCNTGYFQFGNSCSECRSSCPEDKYRVAGTCSGYSDYQCEDYSDNCPGLDYRSSFGHNGDCIRCKRAFTGNPYMRRHRDAPDDVQC